MMIVAIKEFVKTGKFGPVNIGMTKPDVLNLLGQPDSDNDIGENGSILLFGWYELFFDHNNVLTAIQNDNYDPEQPETYRFSNDQFEVDSWFLNSRKNQSISSIISFLKGTEIPYVVKDYFGREVIQVASGVIIDFDEDQNQYGVNELLGIRFWPNVST